MSFRIVAVGVRAVTARVWMAAMLGGLALGASVVHDGVSSARAADDPPGYIRLYPCAVTVIDEAAVPAQEAGVLTALEARPGLRVQQGVRLGQIDERQAEMARRVAAAELAKAREQAENDIKVRYAAAVEKTAEADYMQGVEANRKVPGAVQQTDLRKRLLEYKSSALQVEASEMEQRVAKMNLDARRAENDAAELAIERRQITAPFDGVVVDLLRRQGEWVSPGDPVFRLIRMDKLQVDGFLSAREYGPQEIAGRVVQVVVGLERGRTAAFEGRIVFIDPVVQSDGTYRIRAEVHNREEEQQWILRPGLAAEMHIDLRRPLVAEQERTRR